MHAFPGSPALTHPPMQAGHKQACLAELIHLVRDQLRSPTPDTASISIALGILEACLCHKDPAQQCWPSAFQEQLTSHQQVFHSLVDVEVQARLQGVTGPRVSSVATKALQQPASRLIDLLQAKLKAIADLVWSKLTAGFSKELQHAQARSCCWSCSARQIRCTDKLMHAQHLYCFLQFCGSQQPKGKRQLDCAGVVTTVLAIAQRLALQLEHADLSSCRFQVCTSSLKKLAKMARNYCAAVSPDWLQVSEDHCWLTLDPEHGSREASVEITTDTAAKRGLPVSEAAWCGWLYSGGKASLCSRQVG